MRGGARSARGWGGGNGRGRRGTKASRMVAGYRVEQEKERRKVVAIVKLCALGVAGV